MRKIGIVCAVIGLLVVIATAVLQRADWFAAERGGMSERVEWVVSLFWAGLVLALFGIVFFALSFHTQEEEASFDDYLPPETPQAPQPREPEPGDEDWAPDPRLFQ